MSPRRRPPRSFGKRALLAGAALALLGCGHAYAQGALLPAPATGVPHKPVPDGMQKDEMYMEADEVVRDDKGGVTTAQGNVEVRYNGRTLRADRLVYNDQTGVVRGYGHIIIVNADGTTEYATEIVLDEDLKAGVALGFSARLQQNVKIAAATAAKRSEQIQELNQAIYTPCEICAKDGSPKTPTWSIAADRVVRDQKRRIVYYRNARFRLFGVTVAYLPVF
jgi:LPS-assembly protein